MTLAFYACLGAFLGTLFLAPLPWSGLAAGVFLIAALTIAVIEAARQPPVPTGEWHERQHSA